MAANPRIHVRISNTNQRKLQKLSTERGAQMGAIVDEALTLLFLPSAERPETVLGQQMTRLERQLDRLDAATAFQGDLLLEFIFEWLRLRPSANPLRNSTDEARARSDLEELTRRVVERSNPNVWN